jgi:hypothetical protein
MSTFGLTVVAAATFWSIVYLLLVLFVGQNGDFPWQNALEFLVNIGLLLMLGWMAAGAAYALTRFKMTANSAFTICIVTMALFSYMIASSTYVKLVEPQKRFERRFDRTICKANPKSPGC